MPGERVQERGLLLGQLALGATHTGALPDLAPGERLPLVAVCALAAAMPSCVLGDPPREVTLLADGLDAATTADRTATAGANSTYSG
ncbi:hypothetical protein ACIRS1_37500 [Kitasatospora sp. NPDC101176]|uniref:hypothetical protein n=1 Tax=Kitasatospora sp. NPDC101176 TaxID=3364099 RepID=UPI0038020387